MAKTPAQNRKNPKRLYYIMGSIVVGMFGFGYALVPIYNVMCKQLNINGKTGGATAASYGTVDESRTITIQFLATRNAGMPWEFRPRQRSIRLHPGENKRIAYFAKNTTDHSMTVQAIPSVSPGVAAGYLKKTECFCFTQQTMKAQEAMDWTILFHVDNDLPKNVHTITLAYTLFDLERAGVKPKKRTNAGRIS